MKAVKGESIINTALGYMPEAVKTSVLEYLSRAKKKKAVSEVRLRLYGVSSLTVGGENVALGVRVDSAMIKETLKRITGGALFAHKDDMCRGFISLPFGIRVGVIGHARYDGTAMQGIDEISALVFRIPGGTCDFAKALYVEWTSYGGGMLICSGAGGGKTTAIRALASLIGSGECPRRVAVVDERCEFDVNEYSHTHVDILRGYRRALGVEIAVRTMSAEVLIVDEISSAEDASSMLSALGAGVTVIATVHAGSYCDAIKREYVRRLVDGGLFDTLCILEREGGRFGYRLEKIREKQCENSHGMGVI